MLNQEEIYKVIDSRLSSLVAAARWDPHKDMSGAIVDWRKGLVKALDEKGVVIKVLTGFPLCPNQPADDGRIENNFIKREAWIACRDQLIEFGFILSERLVEEEKDNEIHDKKKLQ